MTTCPICGSDADDLDTTGDADGFDCRHHGKFKVAGTVMVTEENISRKQWENALAKAKARTKTGEWPTVLSGDF